MKSENHCSFVKFTFPINERKIHDNVLEFVEVRTKYNESVHRYTV